MLVALLYNTLLYNTLVIQSVVVICNCFALQQNKGASKTNTWQYSYQYRLSQTRTSGGGSSKYSQQMWNPKNAQNTIYDTKTVQARLEKKNMPYLPTNEGNGNADATDLEYAIADHTAVDNMDENNMFICKACTDRKGKSYIRDVS